MFAVVSLLILLLVLLVVLYVLARVLSPSRAPSTGLPYESVLPYESGSLPQQHAVSRFHPRWYAATVLFLAFDMEMIFMFPWAVVVAEVGASAVVEMFSFLAILVVGVVYAWREGALRWT